MLSIAMMRCDRPFFQNTGGPREQARQDLVPIGFVEHFVAPTGIEIVRDVFEASGTIAIEYELLCRERPHAVPDQHDGCTRVLLSRDACQAHDVRARRVETA